MVDKTTVDKVCVTCPQCAHITLVEVPTERQGQICGTCGHDFVYPDGLHKYGEKGDCNKTNGKQGKDTG